MTKTMIAIELFEMTPNGLLKVIEMETEEITKLEDQQASLSQLTETLYKNDKMYMVFENQGFVIRGLETKTIVLKGKYRIEHGNKPESNVK